MFVKFRTYLFKNVFLYTNVLALRLFQKGFHLLISLLDSCKAPHPPHPTEGRMQSQLVLWLTGAAVLQVGPVLRDVIVIGSAPPTRYSSFLCGYGP
jgi:hypothetical protein